MGSTYPNSLFLKKHIRIKHVRSANLGGTNKGMLFHNPASMSKGAWSNIFYNILFTLTWYLNNILSHLRLNIWWCRKIFCHVWWINDMYGWKCGWKMVPINNSSKSFCSHQVPIKILLFSRLWRIGRWAGRWSVRLLRDSGRVLNKAPQFVGRPEGELQWQADICRRCSRVASQDFLPARFCGRSWADLLLMRLSAVLLPSCAQPKN